VTGDVLAAGERLAIAARAVCADNHRCHPRHSLFLVQGVDLDRLRAALAEYEAATRDPEASR
jgi:hypothetical protein